jgi:hypothetical protein
MAALQKRIQRLGKILKFTEGSKGFWLEKETILPYRWWLMGGVEGDTVLPTANGARTAREAVELAEAWLSPELYPQAHADSENSPTKWSQG